MKKNPFKKAEAYLTKVMNGLKKKGLPENIGVNTNLILSCYANNTPISITINALFKSSQLKVVDNF